MDLERGAEDLLRHGRALDVPAGSAPPPRSVPPRVLGLRLVRLPEREVAGILLQRARRFALLDLVGTLAREPPVLGKARDPEVDVALYRVGVAVCDQLLDEGHDLRHRLGRPRQVVRHAEPEIARVLEIPAGRALGQLGARAGRGVVDLVVDVGDVVHELCVVARRTQPGAKPHADDEGTCIADVGARVDRRAAEVHPHRAWGGRKLDERTRERVVEAHGSRLDGWLAIRVLAVDDLDQQVSQAGRRGSGAYVQARPG